MARGDTQPAEPERPRPRVIALLFKAPPPEAAETPPGLQQTPPPTPAAAPDPNVGLPPPWGIPGPWPEARGEPGHLRRGLSPAAPTQTCLAPSPPASSFPNPSR